jgi:hypothetical protein
LGIYSSDLSCAFVLAICCWDLLLGFVVATLILAAHAPPEGKAAGFEINTF